MLMVEISVVFGYLEKKSGLIIIVERLSVVVWVCGWILSSGNELFNEFEFGGGETDGDNLVSQRYHFEHHNVGFTLPRRWQSKRKRKVQEGGRIAGVGCRQWRSAVAAAPVGEEGQKDFVKLPLYPSLFGKFKMYKGTMVIFG
jgi:hypothetical protein